MKKAVVLIVLLLLVCPLATAQTGVKLGVGVFGGLDAPVGQDDQAQGTVFGFRGRLKALPIITLEPKIAFTSFGEPESDILTLNLDGSKVTAYGIDATLGAPFGGKGFSMFAVVGAGFYNVKRDQTDQDETNLGWSAGLGFNIGFTPLISADVRGVAHVIPYDDGGSKKSVTATIGVNYNFGM
ncbi:MAG: outer membrane beta-barrel protein [Candidatus Zixiibacteriota bacterium]